MLAIVGILAALAASDLSGLIGRYRLNAAARELSAFVEAARVRAISENREYAVVLTTADFQPDSGGVDSNVGRVTLLAARRGGVPGTFDAASDDAVLDLHDGPGHWPGVSLEEWVPLTGVPGYLRPDSIVFSPRGYILNAPSDFASGVIRLVLRNKTASFPERRVVRIDRGGNTEIASLP